MKTAIIGLGNYLPKGIVKNSDFEKHIETNDEWIVTRTGIKSRRIAFNESNLDMGYESAIRAMKDANISPSEIDLIIYATITMDKILPSMSCMLRKKLGAKCPAFDLNAACSGFIYALETADAYLNKEGYNNVLIVASERMSSITNWKDRSTCILFGDGAGSAVVSKREHGLLSSFIQSEDDELSSLEVTYHTLEAENFDELFEKNEESLSRSNILMNGREVFKFATGAITKSIELLLKKANLTIEDIDFVIPHQANIRIIEYASKKSNIPMEKFYINLDKVGNMSASSVPIALSEAKEKGLIKTGDKILCVAFGGGLTFGGMIFECD